MIEEHTIETSGRIRIVSGNEPTRVLAQGARVIRLGTMFPAGDGGNLTVEHRADGHREGFELDPEWFAFVAGLTSTEIVDDLSAEQVGFVMALAEAGGLWVVGPAATTSELDIVVVPRLGITFIEDDATGFTYRTTTGDRFTLSEFGVRLLTQLDGARTLAEMASLVAAGALSDSSDREAIERAEAATARSFDALLMDEVLAFVASLVTSGSASVELSS